MKQGVIALLVAALAGCASMGPPGVQSYQTKINTDDADIAWSRAHAYLARRLCKRSVIAGAAPVLRYANAYLIEADGVIVSREYEKNYVRIRITRPVNDIRDINGKSTSRSVREMEESKEFIFDMLRYITSGNSRHMDDEDAPKK